MRSTGFKKIVVLGHNGFIGSHFMKAFAQKFPGVEIIGRDLPEVDLSNPVSASRLAGDFNEETAVVMLSFIKRQLGDTLNAYEKNMSMVQNLCKVLTNHPIGRLVYFSSAAVYGEDIHNRHITEETPICPTSYYGMAKFSSERLLWKTLNSQKNSSFLILRPTTIYGPGDSPNSYGPVGFVNAMLEKKEIVLWGDGTELRDFVYIDDLVDIVSQLIFRDEEGALNIASGKSSSFKDIFNIIEGQMTGDFKFTSRPRTKPKVDNQFFNGRLVQMLAGFNFITLEEGIRKILAREPSVSVETAQYQKEVR